MERQQNVCHMVSVSSYFCIFASELEKINRRKGLGKKRYIVTPLLLLTLFVAYQVCITMFSHVHYVNGVMIVHSHPSADHRHTHTEGQIVTMAQVASFFTTEPVQTELVRVQPPLLCRLEYNRNTDFQTALHAHRIYLRAPPFCCFAFGMKK